jgi:hypothetical protein
MISKILYVVLGISVLINIFFFVKGGIKVENHFDQRQDQSQYQGQLNVYGNTVSGDKMVWSVATLKSVEEMKDQLKKMDIISSLYSKIIVERKSIIIIYPEFVKKIKDTK